MSAGGYGRARRERAPKPLSVPAIGALIGVLLVVVGFVVGSADVAALGMIFFVWGLLSLAVLIITRRRRASRKMQAGS